MAVDQGNSIDVIVIGGGFGGYYAASTAARHGLSVTLIDSSGKQTFQPLLYQVATGLLPLNIVDYPLDAMHRVSVVSSSVTSIDVENLCVETADRLNFTAERLVLATGASVEFFQVPGAAEFALPLYTDSDALAIKTRLRKLVEDAKTFSVVVVGAGATGVEITGAICDVINTELPRTYPQFSSESVQLHIVDHAQQPLAQMSTKSQAYARSVLEKSGVALHMGSTVASVSANGVTLSDGSIIQADIVIWAGGLTVDLPEITPAPTLGHGGRVTIDSTLRLPGNANVYCIGDCSADATSPLPQLGSVAKQQGVHVGDSLRRQRHGEQPKPFTYKDLGLMAMVRQKEAVVEAGEHHTEITGDAAYAMWLTLHASLLPGDHDRVDAVSDWIQERITGKSKFLNESSP